MFRVFKPDGPVQTPDFHRQSMLFFPGDRRGRAGPCRPACLPACRPIPAARVSVGGHPSPPYLRAIHVLKIPRRRHHTPRSGHPVARSLHPLAHPKVPVLLLNVGCRQCILGVQLTGLLASSMPVSEFGRPAAAADASASVGSSEDRYVTPKMIPAIIKTTNSEYAVTTPQLVPRLAGRFKAGREPAAGAGRCRPGSFGTTWHPKTASSPFPPATRILTRPTPPPPGAGAIRTAGRALHSGPRDSGKSPR